mmetsp:Transcript_15361/g.60038  ORF Transcript_15361/g.60038 Transcript_15361/m.60038 type:complete len:363 (+) Transcript_15361:734-1822(+)
MYCRLLLVGVEQLEEVVSHLVDVHVVDVGQRRGDGLVEDVQRLEVTLCLSNVASADLNAEGQEVAERNVELLRELHEQLVLLLLGHVLPHADDAYDGMPLDALDALPVQLQPVLLSLLRRANELPERLRENEEHDVRLQLRPLVVLRNLQHLLHVVRVDRGLVHHPPLQEAALQQLVSARDAVGVPVLEHCPFPNPVRERLHLQRAVALPPTRLRYLHHRVPVAGAGEQVVDERALARANGAHHRELRLYRRAVDHQAAHNVLQVLLVELAVEGHLGGDAEFLDRVPQLHVERGRHCAIAGLLLLRPHEHAVGPRRVWREVRDGRLGRPVVQDAVDARDGRDVQRVADDRERAVVRNLDGQR